MRFDDKGRLERGIDRLEKAADSLAASARGLEEAVGEERKDPAAQSAGLTEGAELANALSAFGDTLAAGLDRGLLGFADRLLGLLGSVGVPGLGLFGQLLGLFGFAEGGYVSEPTLALVGEGSQPEFIIPEDRLLGALATGRLEELLGGLAGRPVGASTTRVEHNSRQSTTINHIHQAPAVGSLERLDHYSRRAAARRQRREL